MGMLSAMLFFVISHAKPLDKLSPQRPHPNIFSAYVFMSLLGQFAAHMVFLIYMYYGALEAMSKARTDASCGAFCSSQTWNQDMPTPDLAADNVCRPESQLIVSRFVLAQ